MEKTANMEDYFSLETVEVDTMQPTPVTVTTENNTPENAAALKELLTKGTLTTKCIVITEDGRRELPATRRVIVNGNRHEQPVAVRPPPSMVSASPPVAAVATPPKQPPKDDLRSLISDIKSHPGKYVPANLSVNYHIGQRYPMVLSLLGDVFSVAVTYVFYKKTNSVMLAWLLPTRYILGIALGMFCYRQLTSRNII